MNRTPVNFFFYIGGEEELREYDTDTLQFSQVFICDARVIPS